MTSPRRGSDGARGGRGSGNERGSGEPGRSGGPRRPTTGRGGEAGRDPGSRRPRPEAERDPKEARGSRGTAGASGSSGQRRTGGASGRGATALRAAGRGVTGVQPLRVTTVAPGAGVIVPSAPPAHAPSAETGRSVVRSGVVPRGSARSGRSGDRPATAASVPTVRALPAAT